MSRAFKRSEGLVQLLAIQPHQQAAIAEPQCPIGVLAGRRRLSANALARIVNDFLADPAVN